MKIDGTYLPERPRETKHFEYDYTKITSELGYEPKWNVDKGLRQLIEYFTHLKT